jgi:hypothetical protein
VAASGCALRPFQVEHSYMIRAPNSRRTAKRLGRR